MLNNTKLSLAVFSAIVSAAPLMAAAEEQAEWALRKVDDTGIGIPHEHLPHIFERFYTGDASRSSNGSGLGLSIARQIVEAHHGRIDVQSEVNQGTKFTVRLPK